MRYLHRDLSRFSFPKGEGAGEGGGIIRVVDDARDSLRQARVDLSSRPDK